MTNAAIAKLKKEVSIPLSSRPASLVEIQLFDLIQNSSMPFEERQRAQSMVAELRTRRLSNHG